MPEASTRQEHLDPACIHRLSNDVVRMGTQIETLTTASNQLASDIRVQLEAEKNCRERVHAMHQVLFGIDGNPEAPGLQRIVDRHGAHIESHGRDIEAIKAKRAKWSDTIWGWVVLAAITLLGSVTVALFSHLWK